MNPQRYLSALMAFCLAIAALTGCDARDPVSDDREPETVSEGFEPIEDFTETKPQPVEQADLSLEAITGGLSLSGTEELIITRPAEDIKTVAEAYYITGTSNPAQPLTLNGEPVEDRGVLGSFGVFAELAMGENRFVFSQGEEKRALTITRLEYEDYALIDRVTRPRPDIDLAVRSGDPITLSCVAPAGSLVTATIGEQTIEMRQRTETDVAGLAATFVADFDPQGVEGTEDLGPVTYIMNRDGATESVTSAGSIYAVGAQDELLVRVTETASATFVEESDESGYYTTLKKGAVDRVTAIGYNTADEMYKLAMGGWVYKKEVEPLTGETPLASEINAIGFEARDRLESITFRGTATPPYRAALTGDTLTVTLYHTQSDQQPDVSESRIITGVTGDAADGNTVFTFTLDPDAFWGYLVEYSGNDTILTVKRRPELLSAERPLAGITVVLDPGHSGTDDGASGVALDDGAKEKEINLATATATKRYLEGLGAEVTMSREGDEKMDLNALQAFTQEHKPDFMISLHSNSMSYAADGTGPSGVEIFYYEESDRQLAETLIESVCGRTGRVSREAKRDYYKVTLNSLSRSVLVEMGFLTNPAEYDELRTMEGIYDMAVAIGDGLAAYLTEPAD